MMALDPKVQIVFGLADVPGLLVLPLPVLIEAVPVVMVKVQV